MSTPRSPGSAPGRPGRPESRSGRPPRTDRDRRRRELSQNYLRSPAAAEQFLRAVRVDPDGLCLEVGAGEGILTERLAGMCRELVAYELDENVAGRLTARLAGRGNVRVVIGDFLAARPPRTPFQVVGNAPFSVTSPIVDWCLTRGTLTSATLITQLEYARKRTGGYGRWSLLTVSTWPRVRWELRGTIPRTQFRPVPRVNAGILHLARRPEPLIRPSGWAPTSGRSRPGSAAWAARCWPHCGASSPRTGWAARSGPRGSTGARWWPSSAPISGWSFSGSWTAATDLHPCYAAVGRKP